MVVELAFSCESLRVYVSERQGERENWKKGNERLLRETKQINVCVVLSYYFPYSPRKGHTVQAGCDGIEDDSKQVQTNQEALKVQQSAISFINNVVTRTAIYLYLNIWNSFGSRDTYVQTCTTHRNIVHGYVSVVKASTNRKRCGMHTHVRFQRHVQTRLPTRHLCTKRFTCANQMTSRPARSRRPTWQEHRPCCNPLIKLIVTDHEKMGGRNYTQIYRNRSIKSSVSSRVVFKTFLMTIVGRV